MIKIKTHDNKSCGFGCGGIRTAIGIIFGVLIGVLFAFGFISLITTGLWIAFSLGTLVLIYVMISALLNSCGSCSHVYKCLRRYLACLLVGAVGTIITALAALSIVLSTAVTGIIILIALVTFFFAFMITALILFIKCLSHVSAQ